jgi:predicted 3-demethylubiquinone-9 3-methyltransferase (glyoxalase superfamily)
METSKITPRITPFLWFDTEAEQAAQFYTSIFPDSRMNAVTLYDEGSAKASGMPAGSAMTVAFELAGGGRAGQCGWLKSGPDLERARLATRALMTMTKIDIKALEEA